jgi:hypothetical protein
MASTSTAAWVERRPPSDPARRAATGVGSVGMPRHRPHRDTAGRGIDVGAVVDRNDRRLADVDAFHTACTKLCSARWLCRRSRSSHGCEAPARAAGSDGVLRLSRAFGACGRAVGRQAGHRRHTRRCPPAPSRDDWRGFSLNPARRLGVPPFGIPSLLAYSGNSVFTRESSIAQAEARAPAAAADPVADRATAGPAEFTTLAELAWP